MHLENVFLKLYLWHVNESNMKVYAETTSQPRLVDSHTTYKEV